MDPVFVFLASHLSVVLTLALQPEAPPVAAASAALPIDLDGDEHPDTVSEPPTSTQSGQSLNSKRRASIVRFYSYPLFPYL